MGNKHSDKSLDHAIGGAGRVAVLVGAPGIGKSRIVDGTAKVAASRGVDVYTAYCESHASDIPFHAVTRLLRAVFGVSAIDPDAARVRVRAQLSVAHMEDLLLLEDLLGLPSSGLDLPRRTRCAAAAIVSAGHHHLDGTVHTGAVCRRGRRLDRRHQ